MTRGEPLIAEPEAILARVRAVVSPGLPAGALDRGVTPATGDHSLNDWTIPAAVLEAARPAAVLVGLAVRDGTVQVVLTQRTSGLRDHAGQIAFPGGKMDPHDASPAATALREAHEEIGLPPDAVEVIGYLDPYLTRTGFRIVPVVAHIVAPFALVLNPAEVVDAFEVPFSVLADLGTYRIDAREWLGKERFFYTLDHDGRTIWGVTAGILHILAERLAASC